MTPTEPELTPVAVAVAGLTLFLGPQMAAVVGAYVVILFGWAGGVMVGLYRIPADPPVTLLHRAAFMAITLIAVLGVTVPAAEISAQAIRTMLPWLSATEAKGLFLPVAALIPAVGHDWLKVGAWAWGLVRRRIGPKEEQQP